eukprot:Nitzschia sp. Nitz4//scaffold32_size149145//30935//31300//NITZ4_002869-RA/size149145-processed-gene-0.85-mRNA-1//1//CDS//3329548039//1641//frame0
MSIESTLCRELDIRFIDARELVNEAKVNMDLVGYVSQAQLAQVEAEALRLFQRRNSKEKNNMKRANWELEAVKMATGSQSSSGWMDSASCNLSVSGSDTFTTSSSHRNASSRIKGFFSHHR